MKTSVQDHPEATAFLAFVIADLTDDTVRLAYADWLQEHDEPDRAEFIRVQCELERRGSPAPNDERTHDLAVLEHELLRLHEADWRRVGPCAACGGDGKQLRGGRGNGDYYNPPYTVACPTCNGTGDRGGLLREFTYQYEQNVGCRKRVDVEFRRGFPFRVTVPRLSDALETVYVCGCGAEHKTDLGTCTGCMGRGHDKTRTELRPTPWLRSVLAHHPVEEVVPGDRKPYWNGASHVWYREGRSHPSDSAPTAATLLDALFDAIDRPGYEILGRTRGEATPELAVTALARAVVDVGRSAL